MLLNSPGQITSDDLHHVLAGACPMWLAAHGIDEVANLQISMVGWREGQQCYVADGNGNLAPMIFDRLIEDDGIPALAWAPRCTGTRVFTLPKPWVQPGYESLEQRSAQ